MSKRQLAQHLAAMIDAKKVPPLKVRLAVEEMLSEHKSLGSEYDRLYGEAIGAFDQFVREVVSKRNKP